jgi:hypothetical protein
MAYRTEVDAVKSLADADIAVIKARMEAPVDEKPSSTTTSETSVES